MFKPAHRGSVLRSERGAAAAIVTVVLAGGVLMGLGAIAVDVGNIMFERRQLQNGTDAAAMQLAEACADNLAACDDDVRLGGLDAISSANAADNMAALDTRVYPHGQCGRVPGAADMPPCVTTGDIADLGQCPPVPDWLTAATTIPYVETYTLTETADGGPSVASYFGIGEGTTVGACARVAWGPAKGTGVLPLSFGECEWADATGVLDPVTGKIDPSKTPVYNVEVALPVNYDPDAAPCATYNGHDYPGGFGWLEHPNGVCTVQADENDWTPGWPGNGTGNDCLPSVKVGVVLFIPIFDCINDDKNYCLDEPVGAKTNYHIAGMAAFQVTAVDLTGKAEGTPGPDALAECKADTNNKQCIYGKFLKDLVPVGEIDQDPGNIDYGLYVAQPVG